MSIPTDIANMTKEELCHALARAEARADRAEARANRAEARVLALEAECEQLQMTSERYYQLRDDVEAAVKRLEAAGYVDLTSSCHAQASRFRCF